MQEVSRTLSIQASARSFNKSQILTHHLQRIQPHVRFFGKCAVSIHQNSTLHNLLSQLFLFLPFGSNLYKEVGGSLYVTMAPCLSLLSHFHHFVDLLTSFLPLCFRVLLHPQDTRQALSTCRNVWVISLEHRFCFLQSLELERIASSKDVRSRNIVVTSVRADNTLGWSGGSNSSRAFKTALYK